MNISNTLSIGDHVTLQYRLTCHGEEIVNTFAEQPETFYIGGGDIDPRLESLLTGLQVGDHRTFELEPGAAFGNHQPGMVHDLPRADFTAGQALVPGHDVAFTLPNGQTLHGIIRNIDDAMVRVDFNHPLAGLAVEFEVKILAVDRAGKT